MEGRKGEEKRIKVCVYVCQILKECKHSLIKIKVGKIHSKHKSLRMVILIAKEKRKPLQIRSETQPSQKIIKSSTIQTSTELQRKMYSTVILRTKEDEV